MANCSAGRCHIECDGGCSCVYEYGADRCTCECFESGGRAGWNLDVRARVDVSIKDLPLGQVATMFDGLLARDVLVPASRMHHKVRLKLERVAVSHALSLEAPLSLQVSVACGCDREGDGESRKKGWRLGIVRGLEPCVLGRLAVFGHAEARGSGESLSEGRA
jgi:hypothetical protein